MRVSRAVKANCSWLPKGEDATIINEMFTGRANLILAISQWGDWIGLATDNITWLTNWIFIGSTNHT